MTAAHAPGQQIYALMECPPLLSRCSSRLSVGAHRVHLPKIAGLLRARPRTANAFGPMQQPACPRRLPPPRQLSVNGRAACDSPLHGGSMRPDLGLPRLSDKAACRQQRHVPPLAAAALHHRSLPRSTPNATAGDGPSWLPLLQATADGDLSLADRHLRRGWGQIAADLKLSRLLRRIATRTCSPADPPGYSGRAGLPDSREARHFYRAKRQPALRDSARSATGSRPQRGVHRRLSVNGAVHR